jgi:hypothetical protein
LDRPDLKDLPVQPDWQDATAWTVRRAWPGRQVQPARLDRPDLKDLQVQPDWQDVTEQMARRAHRA